ncbi:MULTISPECIES: ferredoxin--NADP reductase [unclassified Arcicella]|uniref:ferredoxin--NADP reductase n=1 Tax=unclassified Arcicella TaxID=2644986 RepID=UPI002863801A|nr:MULTISPECIES: ferredoxin--NADP reductase [unclassified Arcicella]MDR6563685.1 ring-1,2-phenylacetyl-CoA epoxidase subunit PaaE [Arcicella sp. BE51]MDR6814177.1 ring-1,2-phenylacetyl-CoA epoxidase subunit PaaE [Arcicella sp. BE140]MDR6825584.1 ring-1,2-phenylacetyl-CoA epoxidase subunit PaaE [Arcicella sp. BE139]
MSVKYFHLTVKEIIDETPDTKTFTFWHPVHQSVSYKAGQFLTLIPVINGQKVRRSYSMSSSPNKDASIAVTVKRVPGGLVSNYLCDSVKVGDAIEVMEPMGHFVVEPNPMKERTIVLFGGGSGITPLMSILKSVLPVEQGSKVYLVYGSRSEEDIIFRKQLIELELKYEGRFKVLHILTKPSYTWTGYKTRINQASAVIFLKQDLAIDIAKAEYYLCGPEGMMEQVENALKMFNVSTENIHKEHFGSAGSHEILVEEEDDSIKAQTVTIQYEGTDYQVLVKPHETILEAALREDIDLPYSCQAGMCTACLGKCVAGKVHMDEEDGLTEKEIKQGYILTCVSHPKTAGVVIEVE